MHDQCLARLPLSSLAEVNPKRTTNGLPPEALVSFIAMPDVSESGEWTTPQTRQLRSVASGFTSFIEGDVLFAKITPCMENGKGAHAVGLVNRTGFGSTEFHVLRATPRANARFLFYWTQTAALRKKAESFMIGSAGQQRVQPSFFDNFLVPELPLPEQRRVVRILDTVGEAVHQTEQIIAKLQQIKQGLLHDLLTRGIDEQGELRDHLRHPQQFKDSPLGSIPTGWDVQELAHLAEVRSGIAKNSGKVVSNPVTVHYLRVANVQDGYLDLAEMSLLEVGRDDMARYQVLPGDVLMNEGGDLDKLGRGAVWHGEYDPCVHQNHVFVVRCREGLHPEFLNAWTGSPAARRYFMVAGKQTTNLASINKTALGRLPVVVPPLDEQEGIIEALARADRRIEAETTEVEKLRTLRRGLMDDLLTGRVRVHHVNEAQPMSSGPELSQVE